MVPGKPQTRHLEYFNPLNRPIPVSPIIDFLLAFSIMRDTYLQRLARRQVLALSPKRVAGRCEAMRVAQGNPLRHPGA